MSSLHNVLVHDNDDGAFLLFYLDGSNVGKEIFGYFKIYNFKIKDEWTIINCLHIANLVNPNKNISVLHSLILFLLFQCSLNFS
jgi:hypothetical protein